jgi:hypothetical protein
VTVETLTYVALAERLKISPEAARSFSKRLRLPRIRSNDGKTTVRLSSRLTLTKSGTSPCPPGHRVVAPRSPE